MILVDTGPLVALCDRRDARHHAAERHLVRLAVGDLRICEAVLAEACFHLPHRHQRERLRAVIDELAMGVLDDTGDVDFWAAVFDWLVKYADHEPDWADGCLAVLAGRNRRVSVWTYDREFSTTWRRPDGTAIPLAVK